MKKGRIILIVILCILAAAILALLICNWSGAFAEVAEIDDTDEQIGAIPYGESATLYLPGNMLYRYVDTTASPNTYITNNSNGIYHFIRLLPYEGTAGDGNTNSYQFSITAYKYMTSGQPNTPLYTKNLEINSGAIQDTEYIEIPLSTTLQPVTTGSPTLKIYENWVTGSYTADEVNNIRTFLNTKNWYIRSINYTFSLGGTYDTGFITQLKIEVRDIETNDYINLNLYRYTRIRRSIYGSSYEIIPTTNNFFVYTSFRYWGNTSISESNPLYTPGTSLIEYPSESNSALRVYDLQQSLNSQLEQARQEGYQEGYQNGYDNGSETAISNMPSYTAVKTITGAAIDLMSVKLFDMFSILDLLGIVLILGVVSFIIKLARG